MHPFQKFVEEHGIATYDEFLRHEDLLTYPAFQKMMPTYLLWSNQLDGQLQRAFAASVPLGTVFDARFVDGPDQPIEKRGRLFQALGVCEYTELERILRQLWDVGTREEILEEIDHTAHTLNEHVRAYETFLPDLYKLLRTPPPERDPGAEQVQEKILRRGRKAGFSDSTSAAWWSAITEAFTAEDAELTLPSAEDLPTSLIAWNARRLSTIAWLGTRIGRISVADVEDVMRMMIDAVQQRYRSWREFQDAYHVARRLWVGESEANYDDQIAGAWMLRHAHSPWRILPLSTEQAQISTEPTRHSQPPHP